MTPRERVRASISRNALDAIPWQLDLTSASAERLAAYLLADDLIEATDDHIVFVPMSGLSEQLPAGRIRDEFGSVWRRDAPDRSVGDWGGLIEYPIHAPDLTGYDFPEGDACDRFADAASVRARHPDRFLVAAGSGLFEHGWALCGFESFLGYVLSEPEFVEEVTERLAEFSIASTHAAGQRGIDGIRYGDDWGFQDQLIIPPEVWRRIYKPRYRRIFDTAHSEGLTVMIHSCGNITELLPDYIEIGVDVVHPLQPEAMDVDEVRREYGRDLSFWGGVGSQSTLPNGTPEVVRDEISKLLEGFADGGYILAPAGAAPAETPAENLAAFVDAAKSQLS